MSDKAVEGASERRRLLHPPECHSTWQGRIERGGGFKDANRSEAVEASARRRTDMIRRSLKNMEADAEAKKAKPRQECRVPAKMRVSSSLLRITLREWMESAQRR